MRCMSLSTTNAWPAVLERGVLLAASVGVLRAASVGRALSPSAREALNKAESCNAIHTMLILS